MDRSQRRAFFRRHAVGLCGLIVIYVLLSIVRSLRDDFAVEIWRDLGVENQPSVFARSEFWVMLGVVSINGFAILIKNNRIAFLSSLGLLGGGFAIVLAATLIQTRGYASPMFFMVMLGVGMYIPYVAFHTTVFERMIAAFRETATIGYLMYLADAVGYLGYVAVMVYRNTTAGEVSFLKLLIWASAVISIASATIVLLLGLYYRRRIPKDESPRTEPV